MADVHADEELSAEDKAFLKSLESGFVQRVGELAILDAARRGTSIKEGWDILRDTLFAGVPLAAVESIRLGYLAGVSHGFATMITITSTGDINGPVTDEEERLMELFTEEIGEANTELERALS